MSWKDAPWATPETLLAELAEFYAKAIRVGKITSVPAVAAKKVAAHRGWVGIKPSALLDAVAELEVIYIPTGLGPGPALAFAVRDVCGVVNRLQIRLLGDGPEKFGTRYLALVNREAFIGPAWIGMDEDVLGSILQTREILLVEGPLDLLAVRAIGCPIPSLSTLSKRVSDSHWAYLQILGVKDVHAMFDADGAGQRAATSLAKGSRGIRVHAVECPAKDPAEALKSRLTTRCLRDVLDILAPLSE